MLDSFRRTFVTGILLGALAPALAQNYPDRPIRLVVAFVPGGASDTMGRQILAELSEALGQPVLIENRPGANGYLGWNHVANAPADGYTLLLAENALAMSQALYKNKGASPFDPLKQYDAIASMASSPMVLVVANGVKASTIAELVALSKAGPEKMNYASAGIGSVTHLVMEVFRDGVGMDAQHVPYKGGGQAVADVIAGHIPVTFASTQVAKGLVEGGKLKAIAVTSTTRSPALPSVPTLKEAGVTHADVDLRFWYGIFGPRGIQEATKAKLDRAVATVMADPKVRERLAKLDIMPEYAPGAALNAKLANEIRNWGAFVDAKNIKPE
ncbi:MAG TPA: tripartite tricarboxylate transporter substrate binding protein [Burkholderiales bacterium]|nr:tripartite tricarboxylate transporter substrate binding protein [Burkholderiales bacterium]